MEYLVTMTTHVPEGTPDQAVEDIRGREAARSRELAAHGRPLRLWRPPLRLGEWRTLGLFAAAGGGDGQLGEVLASMPLRVLCTDEVTALSPHPNGSGPAPGGSGAEFLTTFAIAIPEGRPRDAVADAESREGLWQAASPAEMQAILRSLPLDPWMTVKTTPLSPHPSDPAQTS